METQGSDHRNKYRFRVTRPAECRLGGEVLRGFVFDEHDEGAFLGPPDRLPNPTFVRGNRFARLVEVGDRVVVRYPGKWYQPTTWRVAVLRWVGYSNSHNCFGYGLHFTAD